jgi:hypothetical protein
MESDTDMDMDIVLVHVCVTVHVCLYVHINMCDTDIDVDIVYVHVCVPVNACLYVVNPLVQSATFLRQIFYRLRLTQSYYFFLTVHRCQHLHLKSLPIYPCRKYLLCTYGLICTVWIAIIQKGEHCTLLTVYYISIHISVK